MDVLRRNLQKRIEQLSANFPIIVILGVRQCGKSTLAKTLGRDWKYYDLENLNHLERISNDPVLFFKENSEHVIVDEAQIYPPLFATLRGVVDEHRESNGRFILTGSASFELMKNVSESLAGRVAIIELEPMKMNELEGEPLSEFFSLFEKRLSRDDLGELKGLKSSRTIKDINHYLLKGGYPQPVLRADNDFFLDWMENYFNTYINRDMRSLFPRIDIIKYQRVIKMLSSISGTIVNKSELARSAESGEKSIRDYLQIISGTFFWRELPAFKTSKIKTTTSLPKGHFRDSGLLLFLQNIFTPETLEFYPKLGNVFESFVVEELIRGVQAVAARNLKYYHFRTKAGGEIDLIIEGSFGLLPIEIKYQSNTTKKQLTSMINFIELHELPYGLVVNNCESPSMITEDIMQIPIACL
jgi:predicted AAA+ superfamily ATPase